VVVPLFALANAGIEVDSDRITSGAPVTVGVLVGLVVGKAVGITGASWLAVRTGLGQLPRGTTWPQLVGVAALAGIGFTVSLFVAGLAFDASTLIDDAKVGILVASSLAAVIGSTLLVLAGRDRSGRAAHP
jgi:NhaA family Na+:H+ antiporter